MRREQIALYGGRYNDDEFGDVLRITCAQRNRPRGARGVNPAMLALGYQPPLEGGLADEEYNLGQQESGATKLKANMPAPV